MRIIGGSARGLRLRVPRGGRVRPTSGRVRTSLFSILGETVMGARVLDLFAGSGALGLEALSRGAAFCWFVEKAGPALKALEDNLARSGLGGRAAVLRCDAFAVVSQLAPQVSVDIVFIDPPYAAFRERTARLVGLLDALAHSPALAAEALVVLQHDSRTPAPASAGPLEVTDTRSYGGTTLTFLERPGERPERGG